MHAIVGAGEFVGFLIIPMVYENFHAVFWVCLPEQFFSLTGKKQKLKLSVSKQSVGDTPFMGKGEGVVWIKHGGRCFSLLYSLTCFQVSLRCHWSLLSCRLIFHSEFNSEQAACVMRDSLKNGERVIKTWAYEIQMCAGGLQYGPTVVMWRTQTTL